MSSRQARGFTLIEVLVALAIVIIAFMAMYGAMLQVVAATTLMQDKTLATWIAFDRITELRVTNSFPEDDDGASGDVEMADSEWVYTVSYIDTDSDNIKQVIVRVALAYDPDNTLGEATGALVKPVAPPNGGPQVPGGPQPPDGDGGNLQ